MKKHTVTVEARHLGLIAKAFTLIQGRRPLTLSYKFGRILEPVGKLQAEFLKQVGPYIQPGGTLKDELTDEQKEEVERLVYQEVRFEVPTVTLKEITMADGLTVDDDTVLPYLVDIGVLAAG